MAGDDAYTALELSMTELADVLFADSTTGDGALARFVALATEIVAGCGAAGVLTIDQDGARTVASTGPLVEALHDLQRDGVDGPCVAAAINRRAYYASDLASDEQWPAFAAGAVALGVRSVLAYPIVSAGSTSALNLYAELPQAFGAADRARGLLLSVFAGLAAGAVDEHERAGEREANLRAALRTRELIGQAQGILMERERITGDQAFALLRDSSQHLNIKLREVAENLVATGETPITSASEAGDGPPEDRGRPRP